MDSDVYAEYAEVERDHWWFQGRRAIVDDVLCRRLPPTSSEQLRILDIGSGTGEMTAMLTHFGHVWAIDESEAAVASLRQRFGDMASVSRGRVPDDLPTSERFDLVTAFDVIEHLEDDLETLSRLRGLTMPGGSIAVTVPAFQFLWSAHDERNHHYRRYRSSELTARLEAAGFEVSFVSYFNAFLFPAIAAVRVLQRSSGKDQARSNYALPPRVLNSTLLRLFSFERVLLRRGRLPFGSSILAVGTASAGRERPRR